MESSPAYSSGRWQIWAAVALGLLLAGAVWFKVANRKVAAPDTSTGSPGVAANSNGETGKVLAGTAATYSEFTQEGYDKAKKDGKVIFLKFYGDWSPISKQADEPVLVAGFNQLSDKKVAGFRVHYADGKNGAVEDALAKEFNVKAEGTKVVVKNGKVVSTTTGSWTAEQFTTEIGKGL